MDHFITITNIHPRGFAFGITDDADQVFIPPHLANQKPLKIGDRVKGQVVINPNEHERTNTKFLAIVMHKDDFEQTQPSVEEKPVGIEELDEKVFKTICDEFYLTTAQIAKELDLDTKTAGNSAMRLFNAGKISKAEVYGRVGQSRPSFLLWAEQAGDFTEAYA